MRRRIGPVLSAVVLTLAAGGGTAVASTSPAAGGTVITGHVTDTTGHALRGAEIRFGQLSEPTSTLAGVTAADGSFRVVLAAGSRPSSVLVEGAPASGVTSKAGYTDTVLSDPVDSRPAIVSPHAGARLDAGTLRVAPAAGESGRVMSADGHPLGQVIVTTGIVGDGTSRTATTDVNGRWTIRGLDVTGHGGAARAWVGFAAVGATGGTSPTSYPNTCLGQTPTPCDRDRYSGPPVQTVALSAGTITRGIGIALKPAVELAGRLTDDRGRGIEGVPVTAASAVEDAAEGTPVVARQVSSDRTGAWRITGLFPEPLGLCFGFGYRVVGAGNGYAPECWRDSDQQVGQRGGTLVTVRPGRVRNGLDAVLVGAGSVRGTVVDAQGAPIRSATVTVGQDVDDGAVPLPAPHGPTNMNGYYRVLSVYVGATTVCATAPGFVSDCRPGTEDGVPVTVDEYETVTAATIVLQAA